MDVKNLNKKKYIYHVYTSSCDNYSKLHFEKFPVIYINQTVVYYKGNRKDYLNNERISSIKNSFSDYLDSYIKTWCGLRNFGSWFEFYCFDIDQVEAQSLYTKYYEKDREEKLIKQKDAIKARYIKALKEVEAILAEADKYGIGL